MSDHTEVGKLRSGGEPRDAIRIAVAPVVAGAGRNLKPGECIGFHRGGDAEEVSPCEFAMSVGIVDPFLMKAVRPGDRFWMFLHPNTITSLRHNWTHPAFGGDHQDRRSKKASEVWLRQFLDSGDGPSYEDLIAAVNNDGESGSAGGDGHGVLISEYSVTVVGHDAYGDIPPEFWDHVEIVVGRKVPWRAQHFSCSC